MKVSYVLLNKTGNARKIPPGHAWQWTVHVEDEPQLAKVLDQLKRDIRDNRLALANLRLETHALDEEGLQDVRFAYKGPVIYDDSIHPQRIIYRHAENA